MSPPTIRPMTAADIPILAGWMVTIPLWQRYGLTVESARAQFERALAGDDILLVADTATERACGFAWCLREGAFGRAAYLRLIGVQPDQAGAGIGAALLVHLEQTAAAFTSDLFLLVSDFNADAHRFYGRHGYEQVGAIPGFVLPDVTELIFRKRLVLRVNDAERSQETV